MAFRHFSGLSGLVPSNEKTLVLPRVFVVERAMRLELTTYSMASCRSSQLSYARIRRYRCGGGVCDERVTVNPLFSEQQADVRRRWRRT
jgi:hypothetical protein